MKAPKCILLAGIFCACWGFSLAQGVAQANAKCPIMTDGDVDPEETVEFAGLKVGVCCGKCGKLWAKNAAYYLKAAPELLPQFKGMEGSLGLDKIVLLPQTFCPMKTKNLICPDSPSCDYRGVKVYFFDQKALEKWKLDEAGNARRALAAGILPQLVGR